LIILEVEEEEDEDFLVTTAVEVVLFGDADRGDARDADRGIFLTSNGVTEKLRRKI
jgi:hypothetical protein